MANTTIKKTTVKATATKTTATKAKTKIEPKVEEVTVDEIEDTEDEDVVKSPKEFKPDDLIKCHSLYAGTLLFTGTQSKLTYTFSNMGDVRYIRYEDLLSGLLEGKDSLKAPYVVVDDAELLETPYWAEIKEIYDNLYTPIELKSIVDMPLNQFKEKFDNLPIGLKESVRTTIATRISDGTFDSMVKVRYVDSFYGNNGLELQLS